MNKPEQNYSILQKGLHKTRSFFESIKFSKTFWDEDLYQNCEDALIQADVGIHKTNEIISRLRAFHDKTVPIHSALKKILIDELSSKYFSADYDNFREENNNSPLVILIAGVNGCGKTTSIAKLTYYFLKQNKSVVLAAADTFRAAAREQLRFWGEHQNVRVIEQQGSDPAAVAFDTIKSAIIKKTDVAIIDTAGRLHTQKNLMQELTRINKVCGKAMAGDTYESWLVIDGSQGQNTLSQVEKFNEAINLSGLIISKLDGSSKGGFILAIAEKFPKLPIRFIGLGEKPEDLSEFNPNIYIDSLIGID